MKTEQEKANEWWENLPAIKNIELIIDYLIYPQVPTNEQKLHIYNCENQSAPELSPSGESERELAEKILKRNLENIKINNPDYTYNKTIDAMIEYKYKQV